MFEEGLEFPGFCPPTVVGDVGFEGADQGAVFSFGAQGCVDFEEAVGAESDEFNFDPGGRSVCWFSHADNGDG